MKWVFARNDGGRDSGFHDAGVETFKGNFDRYLARELIQNSLDARLDPHKPEEVRFDVSHLKPTEIPDIANLCATLARCKEYWSHTKKARVFFERAEAMAEGDKIAVLKVRDYNTFGVRGGDADREREWYNLIRCAGSSSKGGGEGGSFGIGKNAPFAASQMRTVLYSTHNTEGEHVFQGVAMLASHKLPDGGIGQPTGYLGGEHGGSVRTASLIPKAFQRHEKGTDIIVLGFPAGDNWERDLIFSVLDNFWPAIDFGDLVVKVGDQQIEAANLAQLLESFGAEEKFDAHLYYRAFKSPDAQFPSELKHLKKVSAYFSTGSIELPKKVAMVRQTGMVVFPKTFRAVTPFCGVFMCRNDDGNRILREMEPPRHDMWDADHPEKGLNKKIESEYIHFLRDCIKKLVPTDDSKVISIPGLNRFLPDDEDAAEESFGDETETKSESFDRSPLPQKVPGKKIDSRAKPKQPDESKPEDGEEETEAGAGDGSGGRVRESAGKPLESSGGGGGGAGGSGSGNAGEVKGKQVGTHSKPAVPLRYRSFANNPAAGVYSVTVQADAPAKSASLIIWTVGDDQRAPADLKSARLPSGEKLEVIGPGALAPIALSAEPIRLEVVLAEPLRVKMEVSAHEA